MAYAGSAQSTMGGSYDEPRGDVPPPEELIPLLKNNAQYVTELENINKYMRVGCLLLFD